MSPNPSQRALAELVAKLEDEEQPKVEIADALLYLGAMLLGEVVPPRHVDTIADLVKDVATHPNNPISIEVRRWMRPS